MADPPITIGQFVKSRRGVLGLTQAALADLAGYSSETLRKVERDTYPGGVNDLLAQRLILALALEAADHDRFLALAAQSRQASAGTAKSAPLAVAKTVPAPTVAAEAPAAYIGGHRKALSGPVRRVVIGAVLFAAIVTVVAFAANAAWAAYPMEGVNFAAVRFDHGSWVRIESNGRMIRTGDNLKSGRPVTITYQIANTGLVDTTVPRIGIAFRGPGVSCADPLSIRWSWPEAPFPVATQVGLPSNGIFEYRRSRVVVLPGRYFVEPVFEYRPGRWNGLSPFPCIDLEIAP